MQKLVSLYLSNLTADRMLHEDGDVREHLQGYLDEGWRIVSITPVGAVSIPDNPAAAWVMVLLQKTKP